MLLRRGQNRWLVLYVATVVTFLLVCFYGDILASLRRMATTLAPPQSNPSKPLITKPNAPLYSGDADVELVVAATQKDNITWLNDYLLAWPKNIYSVDNPKAELTVPKNKGREAMVILTYIIDRYDSLPANILFHHAERFQWHNDDPDYDALQLLKRFRVTHLQENGYVNLRCSWILGCPADLHPAKDEHKSATNDIPTAKFVYRRAFEELFPGQQAPSEVGVPCCSQFGVTRETVRLRPREDYISFRDWLLSTDIADEISGRVFEYAWHIIFNKESVHCPHAGECFCKQYGMCHRLDCDQKQCPGQYHLPKYSNLPHGWPMFGWKGEDRHWSGEL
ncbi:hypothetical protein NQ176_g9403 [Zarea fungicola]|uniref:Uncharacterized protein n=1 Tax=Zarea fungicola TaxID=93591 RepID=A0ACC1MM01_9HYPO|nr:hypothetical protein NQ176_g9403 [Lecanicillium fungicola]